MTDPRERQHRDAVPTMTMDRFRILLEAYGADAGRWPAAERAAAQALVEASPAARAAMDEARQLDAALDRLAGIDPTPALVERILAAAPVAVPGDTVGRRRGPLASVLDLIWPGAAVWKPATALAASLCLGLAAGSLAPAGTLDIGQAVDVSTLVFPGFEPDADGSWL